MYFQTRLYIQYLTTSITYINKLEVQASLEDATVLKGSVWERAGFVVRKTDFQRLG